MYLYRDYFDPDLAAGPYGSPAEETEDYLRLLDMLLEGYLEFKGLGSDRKLFSRGLVITESEMERFFSLPPRLRERDLYDPVLTNAAEAAFSFIEKRTARTAESGRLAYPGMGLLRIDSLRKIFGLDRTGVMAVILALAGVIDRRYERIFGFLQDDIARTRPTSGLLEALMARITPRGGAEELLRRPLPASLFRSLFLSDGEERGLDTPLILNPLLERILLNEPDAEDRLPEPVTLVTEEPGIPLFFKESAKELAFVLEDPRNDFCYVENEDDETVLHLAAQYAAAHQEVLYALDLDSLTELAGGERNACLADLTLRLRLKKGRLIVRLKTEGLSENISGRDLPDRRWRMLTRVRGMIPRGCVLLFGEAKEPGWLIRHAVPFLHVPAPDVTGRTEIWNCFLKKAGGPGAADGVPVGDLADCYDISYGTIKNTCSHAGAAAGVRRQGGIRREDILESLRQLCQVDFSGLANYVPAVYTWEDIRLTEDQRAVLKTACDRYRLRGRVGRDRGLAAKNAYGNGVSLLLYGPPGTGKTMAAQVVAGDLGLPLYRVDISRIFSKYIGETEKNLSVVFDAAKGANVILFFDEADALFAKRTEVSSANDKYANSETAYLLQKIEEYDGMSILATNLYASFDPAFMRRITYAVRLDSPDEEARYTLWTTILPKEAETEEIPFRFLAKQFELSGGNIKAILYSAVYMAGAEGVPAGMRHIVRAMEYEFRKLGRFIDREAFGPYAGYLTDGGSRRERDGAAPETRENG